MQHATRSAAACFLLGAVACGSTHRDVAVTADSGPDVLDDAGDATTSADADADAEVGWKPDAGDADAADASAVCTDAGLPVSKKWRVTCCNGAVCQGTCENGQCSCAAVAGGCEHLRCCDVGGAGDEKLVCGGEGVCWPYQ